MNEDAPFAPAIVGVGKEPDRWKVMLACDCPWYPIESRCITGVDTKLRFANAALAQKRADTLNECFPFIHHYIEKEDK